MTVGADIALLFAGVFSRIGPLQAAVGPFSFSWGVLIAFIPAIISYIVFGNPSYILSPTIYGPGE